MAVPAAVPIALGAASLASSLYGAGKMSKSDKAAANALNEAVSIIQNLGIPSIEELTMPELEQFVVQGILTPAQAEAASVAKSAYEDIELSPEGVQAQIAALNQLQNIAAQGGMTDTMRARLNEAQDQMRTKLAGERGSIMDQYAKMGTPTSLMGFASQMAAAGEDARSANLSATEAAADAEARALEALQAQGTLGGQIREQQASEEQAKAAARDAIAQFNAGNKQATELANVQARNVAQAENLSTAQDIANQNVGLANERTRYNVNLPQVQFDMGVQKAGALTGALGNVAQNQTSQAAQQGQFWGNLGAGAAQMASQLASSEKDEKKNPFAISTTGAKGGVVEARGGGMIVAPEMVPGDSELNDIVPALLSDGEVIAPRTVVDAGPETTSAFIREVMRGKHPNYRKPSTDDVRKVLTALATI